MGWLITEVNDDGCVTSRSEVADDHSLGEVDLTRLSELLKPFKVVAIDGVVAGLSGNPELGRPLVRLS
jgi:hypothetical protein